MLLVKLLFSLSKALHVLNFYRKTEIYDLGEKYEISGDVWTTLFHKYYGLCHTFSLSKADNLDIEGSLVLAFVLKDEYIYPIPLMHVFGGTILMHSGTDLPDAGEHSSTVPFFPNDLFFRTEFIVKKTSFTIEPTLSQPCGKLHPDSCRDFELNKFIQQTYNCHAPLLNTGIHTQQNVSLPVCNNSVLLEVLELSTDFKENCDPVMPCEHAGYQTMNENVEVCSVTFKDV